MSTEPTLDVEQLLAETWSPELAGRIADRVGQARGRGYLVRGVQPEVRDQLMPGDVVFEEVMDAIHAETGVDVDHAREEVSFQAVEDVVEILAERWQDGEPLPAVPESQEEEAAELLAGLTMKAAESAGCEVTEEPWEPLRAGGRLRVDVEGLQGYLDFYAARGIEAEEREAIHRLMTLAADPSGS